MSTTKYYQTLSPFFSLKKPSVSFLFLFLLKKTLSTIVNFGATFNLMVDGKLLISLFFVFFFNFLVTNKINSLNIIELFNAFIRFDLVHIIGFKVSHGESLESYYQFHGKKMYMTSSWVLVLLIQSIVSNLSLLQTYTRSKGGCIKQHCDRGKISVLDVLYNNRDFLYIDVYLIKLCIWSIITLL